jgi:hypothetical protein
VEWPVGFLFLELRDKLNELRLLDDSFAKLSTSLTLPVGLGFKVYPKPSLTLPVGSAPSQDLKSHMYSNPHSMHSMHNGADCSSDREVEARRLTLQMCNASESDYVCVFTSGATGHYAGSVLVLLIYA